MYFKLHGDLYLAWVVRMERAMTLQTVDCLALQTLMRRHFYVAEEALTATAAGILRGRGIHE